MSPQCKRFLAQFLLVVCISSAGVLGGIGCYLWSGWPGAIFFLCLLLVCGGASFLAVWYAGPLRTKSAGIGEGRELEQLQNMVERDFLTGVYSRQAISARIGGRLNTPGAAGALIILDIDNFKRTNDRYGQHGGDEALKSTAARLLGFFQEDALIGRAGGDEFVVFTEQIADKASLVHCLSRLHALFQQGGSQEDVTISLGATLFPQDGLSYTELFRKADQALYNAKQAGKNRWRVYCPSSCVRP